MKDNASKILFSLSETDKNIQELKNKKNEIEKNRRELGEQCQVLRARVSVLEEQFKECQARRLLEEQRLKEEELRIVERRRQLTALGGVKSAKLIEREIDIATRAQEALERNLGEATSVLTKVDEEFKAVQARLSELEQARENDLAENDKVLQQIGKKLAELDKERNVLLGKIDERLRNLYARVNNHYPGQAVALAKSASCRSCYRALPAQLYNQVMAGNRLLQCPGCSRILVFSE